MTTPALLVLMFITFLLGTFIGYLASLPIRKEVCPKCGGEINIDYKYEYTKIKKCQKCRWKEIKKEE